MEKVIHRIKKFIDDNELSMRAFDLKIGVSDGYTQRTVKNSGSIGSDVLEKILDAYPEINPYWLLTGKGSINSADNSESETEIRNQSPDAFEKMLLEYLDRPAIADKIINLISDERKQD